MAAMFVNNDHLQSSLSFLRNEADLMILPLEKQQHSFYSATLLLYV
jgi:hypothetical protein